MTNLLPFPFVSPESSVNELRVPYNQKTCQIKRYCLAIHVITSLLRNINFRGGGTQNKLSVAPEGNNFYVSLVRRHRGSTWLAALWSLISKKGSAEVSLTDRITSEKRRGKGEAIFHLFCCRRQRAPHILTEPLE